MHVRRRKVPQRLVRSLFVVKFDVFANLLFRGLKIRVTNARVSTQDQISGLESQLRILTEYCQKQQYHNFLIFTDEGVSGAKASRPGLDQLMAKVREGAIEKVIVYSFSRFARSVTHLLNALEEFKTHEVAFISYI